MNTLIQRYAGSLSQFRDLIFACYFLGMLVMAFVVVMEAKLYFNMDFIPGVDVPIDEWYTALFK